MLSFSLWCWLTENKHLRKSMCIMFKCSITQAACKARINVLHDLISEHDWSVNMSVKYLVMYTAKVKYVICEI